MASRIIERLSGISDRRQEYVDYARKGNPNPFEGKDDAVKDKITTALDVIKNKPSLTTIVREIYSLLKEIPEDETERAALLERVQEAIFPRLAELTALVEDVEATGGIPPESGFTSEDELVAEYEILAFIYGGSSLDFEEVRNYLEARPSEAEEAAEITPTRVEMKEIPENLPNDFFRFLYENKVPWSTLMGSLPEDEADRAEFLKQKYITLGNIFISIVLGKMENDMSFDFLRTPTLSHVKLGSFESAKAATQYDAETLMKQVPYGTDRLSVNERKYAEQLVHRLESVYNVVSVINTAGQGFFSAADSLDQLAKFYYPTSSAEKGLDDTSRYFDHWFWNALLGEVENGEVSSPLRETHFMYLDENGEWQQVEKSMTDQLLEAYLGMKEASRFPGQKSNQLGVYVPLVNYPKQLRYATAHYAGKGDKNRDVYKPKIVRQPVSAPTAPFPFTIDQPESKKERKEILQGIMEEKMMSRDDVGELRDKEELSSKYMLMNAANMMASWWTASSMEGQLKPVKGGPSWGDLLGKPYKDALADGTLERAATVRDQQVDLGPAGLNLPQYSTAEIISGLTLIEKWTLEGKLKPYVLGVLKADKVFKMDQYADKTISDPDSYESAFQQRAIGLVKGFIIPFEEYYIDYETGETIGDMLEQMARGDNTPELLNRFKKTLGEVPTQNFFNHVKDGIFLTNTEMDGLKGGPIGKIATLDIEKNVVSDLNESYINSIRGFYRVLYGYQYSRDSRPPKKVEEAFFNGEGSYDNLGKHFIVVKVVDANTGRSSQKLVRNHKFYHFSPQDLMVVADVEAMKKNGRSSSQYAPSFRGVPVLELVLDDASKVPAFSGEKEREQSLESNMNAYIDTLMMRHCLKVFFFAMTAGDELKNLTYEKRLLFGMVFSKEMREKYIRGEYTRGVISQKMVDFVRNLPFVFNFVGEDYFDIELPDMAGKNLLTERLFYQFMYDLGYIRNLGEFNQSMSKAAETMPLVK